MAKRICRKPGCPAIIDAAAYKGFCDQHRRDWDKARGSREERGYGADFQAERADWVRRIAAGEIVNCWRCGGRITGAFHLGHSDDRSKVNGPEHPKCNLRAAGQAAHIDNLG